MIDLPSSRIFDVSTLTPSGDGAIRSKAPSGIAVVSGGLFISGTEQVGQPLSCSDTVVSDAGLSVVSRNWYRNGVAISGATSLNYTLAALDQTKDMQYKISGVDDWGNIVNIQSNILGPIAASGGGGAKASGDWFVSPTGLDTNDGLTASTPFLTFTKADSVVSPGEVISLLAGTYRYASGTIFYNTSLDTCLSPLTNGTAGNYVTWQAAIGAEGAVFIDGNTVYDPAENGGDGGMAPIDVAKPMTVGINLSGAEYIKILDLYIQNTHTIGIGADGALTSGIYTPGTAGQSTSCLITSNVIEEFGGDTFVSGPNVDGVRFTNTVNWIVRNNVIRKPRIDGVIGGNHCSGMQTYQSFNALIENNKIVQTNVGIAFKAHWYKDNLGAAVTEAETRYNFIEGRGSCYYTFNGLSVQGGTNSAHHNVFRVEFGIVPGAAFRIDLSDAPGTSSNFSFYNNVIDANGSTKQCMDLRGYTSFKSNGNIFRCNGYMFNAKGDGTYVGTVTESDYNVVASSGTYEFRATPDANLPSGGNFTTLLAWRAAISSSFVTLNFINAHELNSVATTYNTEFTDPATDDYTLKVGASASGIMADNSDAGCHQYGTEIIGVTGWVATA